MHDRRFGVSPVNYSNPDPEKITLQSNFSEMKNDVMKYASTAAIFVTLFRSVNVCKLLQNISYFPLPSKVRSVGITFFS